MSSAHAFLIVRQFERTRRKKNKEIFHIESFSYDFFCFLLEFSGGKFDFIVKFRPYICILNLLSFFFFRFSIHLLHFVSSFDALVSHFIYSFRSVNRVETKHVSSNSCCCISYIDNINIMSYECIHIKFIRYDLPYRIMTKKKTVNRELIRSGQLYLYNQIVWRDDVKNLGNLI